MNCRSILLLVLSLYTFRGMAQTDWSSSDFAYATSQMTFKAQRVIPPTPEAAELGRYGNMPVSFFTGTPSIHIPLYELKGSQLDLPISLSYNAGGFRPQDIASWVGLGWSLNAGGVITRSVVGNPDLSENYFFPYNNYQTPPPVNNLFANYDYMDSIQRSQKETQPDVYFYNFGNYSGKFWLNTNQQVIRKEKTNLKITASLVANDATGSSSFTIVDENGNTYLFAATEISMMQQNDAVSQQAPEYINYVYPSSWFLSSITSADGSEQMVFNYFSADSTQTMYNNYLQSTSYSYQHSSLSTTNVSYETGNGINYGTPPLVTINHRKYLQSVSLIKSGVGTLATVNFSSLNDQRQDLDHLQYPEEKLLQNMQVSNSSGLVKKFNFYFSYFNNPSYTDINHLRLRLDSVSEAPVDGSGLYKPPYSFVYDASPIPSLAQASVDHWGFYNGSDMVSTLVPYYSTGDGQLYGGGANRNPDLGGSSTAILQQIHYPTGGYTSFSYELNACKDPSSGSNLAVGGIRIQQMVDYSFPGKQAIVKNYVYTLDDGSSSGVAAFPTYASFSQFHHNIEQVLGQCTFPQCTRTTTYDLYYMNLSASSIYGLGTIQGSHIGYTNVQEYQTDAVSGAPLGRTVYHYYANIAGSHDDDIGNGDLLDKAVYDNNGKIQSHQANTYNFPSIGTDGSLVGYSVMAATAQDNFNELCQYLNGSDIAYAWIGIWEASPTCISNRVYTTKLNYLGYTLSSQYKELVAEVDTAFDQQSAAYIVTTKKYTYGNPVHTFPTVVEEYSSNNDEIVSSMKYAGDYTIPGGSLDGPSQGLLLLQSKNMLGHVIEKQIYRQNLDGTNKRYIDGQLNFYDALNPYLLSIYRIETTTPPASLQPSSTDGTFTYDPSYQPLANFSYDVYGNIVEQSKAQDMITSYIWDYQHWLPVAEVKNANASMIAYAGFEAGSSGGNWLGYNPSNVEPGGVAGNSSYNLVSGSPLSDIGLTSGRLYKVSYWKSGSGAVSVSSDQGSASSTAGLSYNGWTYYEWALPPGSMQVTVSGAGANIDELRLFPADALMSTLTYQPLVGATSQCPPTNQFTYYQYDGLSRLTNILDQNHNIVKNIKYNYGLGDALPAATAKLFYNSYESQSYTRQGCTGGSTPTSVTYSVPFGKYVSSVSQSDADSKALAEISANGQTYANVNGQCLFYNVAASQFFFKNDCIYSQGPGTRVTYTVPAGKYSSPIDQATADALASQDLANNGPNYANAHGTCSCSAEGQKYINGTCTTGTRFNVSSTQLPDGTWQCVYYYSFSDGTVSQNYTSISSSSCPIQ